MGEKCECGARQRGPKKQWSPFADGSFRLSADDTVWILRPTPRSKYPWLLSGGDGITQEVTARDAAEAQSRAEFWLDISRLFPRPLSATPTTNVGT
ncbi:hypothetical protein ACFWY9_14720 [Amycolatopsis sp. NPDC059027]|uniref:hypothetical protein n=1 Tax=unclassified Amycolatopsis TaxID=2618356 RepID=UPI00366A91B4